VPGQRQLLRRVAVAGLAFSVLALTNAATYWQTRATWWELGRQTGIIAGEAEVLRKLCTLASTTPPAAGTALGLALKAELVELAPASGGGYTIHCR